MPSAARARRVHWTTFALGGRSIAEFPLVALDDVPAGSFLGRAWDSVRLWIKQL